MKKEKQKTLKQLHEELLNLVKEKYYGKDDAITECVNSLNIKTEQLQAKREKKKVAKENLGQKVKKVISTMSLKTLLLCDKLIVKEKLSNQIMGYTTSIDLETAEREIKAEISNKGQ